MLRIYGNRINGNERRENVFLLSRSSLDHQLELHKINIIREWSDLNDKNVCVLWY